MKERHFALTQMRFRGIPLAEQAEQTKQKFRHIPVCSEEKHKNTSDGNCHALRF